MRRRTMGVAALAFVIIGCGGPPDPERHDAAVDAGEGAGTPPFDASMGTPDGSATGSDAGFHSPSSKDLSLHGATTDSAHRVLAVDPGGRIVATAFSDTRSRLWASADARTWTVRGTFPGHDFLSMSALQDGVLVADTVSSLPSGAGFRHVLARSADGGATWQEILVLGDRSMLQPHSVAELDGTVFFAEYQTTSIPPVPINLWASLDRGATWSVRHTFLGFRHAHSLLADPASGSLWAFMGDATGATLRSSDMGVTWSVVIPGLQGVIVDAVMTPNGLLFGTDGLYRPAQPRIERLAPGDLLSVLQDLPGPSYSVHKVDPAGFLLGTTRETGGDVYAPGDDSAHLFSSVDGMSWREIMSFPRIDPTAYGRIDVYWSLPDGRVVVEVANGQEFGMTGSGFMLATPVLR